MRGFPRSYEPKAPMKVELWVGITQSEFTNESLALQGSDGDL